MKLEQLLSMLEVKYIFILDRKLEYDKLFLAIPVSDLNKLFENGLNNYGRAIDELSTLKSLCNSIKTTKLNSANLTFKG